MTERNRKFRRQFYRNDDTCMSGPLVEAAPGDVGVIGSRPHTPVYQLRATVTCKDGMEKSYCRVIDLVLRFVGKSLRTELPADAAEYRNFDLKEDGFHCECVAIPERFIWAISFDFIDKGGVTWFYNVSLSSEVDKLLFGIRIEISPGTVARPLQSDLPLLQALLDSNVLEQGMPLADNFRHVCSEEDVDRLIGLLGDTNRTLPVVAVSEINRSQQYAPNYPIHAELLAKQLKGYAIVVRLTGKAAFALSERVGKAWAVFDGAVRIYYPKADFENGCPQDHPWFRKEKIKCWFSYNNGKHGPEAFMEHLVDLAFKSSVRTRMKWHGLFFVAGARIIAAEREMAKAQIQACPPEEERASQNYAVALQKKNEALEKEILQWMEAWEKAEESVKYYKRENAALRMRMDAMRANLRRQNAVAPDAEGCFPLKCEGVAEWVKNNLAGQLVLLPRAERALAKARYENVGLVCRALLILANEYRDSRLGLGTREAFKAELDKNALDFSESIDKCRAGQEGEEYYVNYPVGSDSKVFLQYHITKGNSREERYCMRIYFFWDEENRQVVVGSLPSHLSNRIS